MFGIIYKALNLINGKVYVGQTTNCLNHRIAEHKRSKKLGAFPCAVRKYGINSFKFVEIDHAKNREELNNKEMFWIDFLECMSPNGYNLTVGGEGTNGYKFSEEHCNNLSIAKKNISDETRLKMSVSSRGRILSDSHKKKTSESLKGIFRGPMSDITKDKLREINKGKTHSMETRSKLSQLAKGKKKSDEHCKNISKGNKGRIFSNEHCNKLKIAWKRRRETEAILKIWSVAI